MTNKPFKIYISDTNETFHGDLWQSSSGDSFDMMQSQTNFFLTLPSNAKGESNNKPYQFKVKLAAPLDLEGRWEIALTEVQYPRTFCNVKTDGEFEIMIGDANLQSSIDHMPSKSDSLAALNDSIRNKRNSVFRAVLPKGYYTSIEEMCRYLDVDALTSFQHSMHAQTFPSSKSPVRFRVNKDNPGTYVTIESQYPYARVKIPNKNDALQTLGMFGASQAINALPHSGTHNTTLPSLYSTLYIYSDIVDYGFVGDTRAPLLRTVPIEGKQEDIICTKFAKPYYLPLSKGYISEIEIKICNDQGEVVPFESGTVLLVVHLRKCGLTM